jgi:SAM-dependent methyltransferase
MAEYSYTLDPAEILRYQMMASWALDREADLWDAAGITSDAAVVDLGCGPGIFLPELASRTAPAGRLVGVDESGPAVTAARQLAGQIDQLDLGVRIQIVQARAHATGLALGTFDVVFIRNLLLHNGASASAILEHSHLLLRPGGHLFCVEADITRLQFLNAAPEERDLELCWVQMAQSMGNDPALGAGSRLADLIAASRFSIVSSRSRVDPLTVERSPAWTARNAMIDTGFASQGDIDRWHRAITTRLQTAGQLKCRLPLTAVVARRLEQPANLGDHRGGRPDFQAS